MNVTFVSVKFAETHQIVNDINSVGTFTIISPSLFSLFFYSQFSHFPLFHFLSLIGLTIMRTTVARTVPDRAQCIYTLSYIRSTHNDNSFFGGWKCDDERAEFERFRLGMSAHVTWIFRWILSLAEYLDDFANEEEAKKSITRWSQVVPFLLFLLYFIYLLFFFYFCLLDDNARQRRTLAVRNIFFPIYFVIFPMYFRCFLLIFFYFCFQIFLYYFFLFSFVVFFFLIFHYCELFSHCANLRIMFIIPTLRMCGRWWALGRIWIFICFFVVSSSYHSKVCHLKCVGFLAAAL